MATIHADCRFTFRSDTAVNWQTNNPTLLKGEIGTVTDGSESEKMKIGDGVTPWNSLGWFKGAKGEQGIQGIKGDRGLQGEKGDSGFSPVATVTKSGSTTTISVTDSSGTTTANVQDGTTPAVDQTYNPAGANPQSGVAVGQAVNWETISDETTTQSVVVYSKTFSKAYKELFVWLEITADTSANTALGRAYFMSGNVIIFNDQTNWIPKAAYKKYLSLECINMNGLCQGNLKFSGTGGQWSSQSNPVYNTTCAGLITTFTAFGDIKVGFLAEYPIPSGTRIIIKGVRA